MSEPTIGELRQKWPYNPEWARDTPKTATRLTVKQRLYIDSLATETPEAAGEIFRVVSDVEGDIDHLTVGGAMWVINQLLDAKHTKEMRVAKSNLEREFATRWRQLAPDAPEPIEQYRWAAAEVGLGPGIRKRLEAAGLRDWQLDFAWLEPHKVAVEIQGGTWSRGRHTRGAGYRADCERLNALQAHGWRVFYVTSGMLRDDAPAIIEMVKEAL